MKLVMVDGISFMVATEYKKSVHLLGLGPKSDKIHHLHKVDTDSRRR